MYVVIIKAIKDAYGKDMSGKVVPMPAGSTHLVSRDELGFYRYHSDVFQILNEGPIDQPVLAMNVLTDSIVGVSDSTGMDGFVTSGAQTQYCDNIAWWAAAYSKGALSVKTSCSIPGWTTTEVDLYWAARIAAIKPRFVLLAIGLNNIFGATDATVVAVDTALRTWIQGRIAEVIAWGGIPILQTMFPAGSTYSASTATKRKQHFEHNKWRRQYAASRGIPLLDAESLTIDHTTTNADPYIAYFQPTGSPHPGKEMTRELGAQLWSIVSRYVPAMPLCEQANRYITNQIFSNPGFTGTAGNLNGGLGTLPNEVWGWTTSTGTTYSITASTDSKLSFAGAPVKSPWVTVTTDVATNAVASAGIPYSSSQPGLLFIAGGLNLTAGDIIYATAEIEIVTPNTLIGFQVILKESSIGTQFQNPNPSNAFTPASNADNSKNHILTSTTINLPLIELTIPGTITGNSGGIWLTVNPQYSGLSGATGSSVWRIRNLKVWKKA